uniref:Uncharacterized protein n=1 Tax=Romanomermis culicivorax TaxID=13658 RepID=A0A915I6A4_ROMCU
MVFIASLQHHCQLDRQLDGLPTIFTVRTTARNRRYPTNLPSIPWRNRLSRASAALARFFCPVELAATPTIATNRVTFGPSLLDSYAAAASQ